MTAHACEQPWFAGQSLSAAWVNQIAYPSEMEKFFVTHTCASLSITIKSESSFTTAYKGSFGIGAYLLTVIDSGTLINVYIWENTISTNGFFIMQDVSMLARVQYLYLILWYNNIDPFYATTISVLFIVCMHVRICMGLCLFVTKLFCLCV